MRHEHGGARYAAQMLHHELRPQLAVIAGLALRLVGHVERDERRLLDEPRQSVQHADQQVLGVVHQRLGTDHPAGAPAAHGVGLRKAAEGDHPLRHRLREARHPTARGEAGVDLVGDDPQVVPMRDIADRSPFLSREDDAGGIAGVGEEQRSRARRDRSLEVGGVQPEAVLRAQRHRHQMRARGFERPRIGGVERVEGQHLVAFAADAHRCGEQGVLGARGDDDLVLAHRLSRAPLVQLRDGAS